MRVHIYILCSPVDSKHRFELEKRLAPHSRLLSYWSASNTIAGNETAREVEQQLGISRIAVWLISADFRFSEEQGMEARRAIELERAGTLRIIPVLIRSTTHYEAPYEGRQMLPDNGAPVSTWTDRDAAWRNIVAGIRRVAQEIADADEHSSPSSSRPQAVAPVPSQAQARWLLPLAVLVIAGSGASLLFRVCQPTESVNPTPTSVFLPPTTARSAQPSSASPPAAHPPSAPPSYPQREPPSPPNLVLTDEPSTPQLGGARGYEFIARCAPNQVVVGFQGMHKNQYIYRLGAICANLAASPQPMPGGVHSVTMERAGNTNVQGEPDGADFSVLCPHDSAVTKIKIEARTYNFLTGPSHTYVVEIVATCSRYAVDGKSLRVTSSEIATLDPIGLHDSSAKAATYSCNNNGVLTGFAGRSAKWMEALRFSCASLSAER